MLRGIDKRDLFLNDSDYQKVIDYIQRAKEKIEFTVYAYCLLTNHTHLLLKKQTASLEIGDIVKRITVGHAQYHNVKNGRTGHLFQNRFKSEAVESDTYFLTVLRYIHIPETLEAVIEMLNAQYGLSLTGEDVIALGKTTLTAEREFNKRAGFTSAHDRLPEFFQDEAVPPHNATFDVPEADLDAVFAFADKASVEDVG
ncbi:MAG: transposase [Clostridia bacterium]|nr:transposase [Clostridia bacterium]